MIIYKIRPIISGLCKKDIATLKFAASELQKYLSAVSEDDFSLIPSYEYNKNEKNSIYLGINLSSGICEVDDKELDDAIYIDTNSISGLITGSNARSVLIAVYRFLKELGFSFLRPGEDGEYYPDKLYHKKIFISEKASYRHRAICIEGSLYQKYLTDIIDWLPKAALNGYFIQFQLPKVFFDRFYEGETPYRGKTKLSDDDIRSIVSVAEEEMEKRSLLYHAVGHGWTTQAFGIDGSSWSVHDEPENKYNDVLALVKGERKLWDGVPLNTNLCYSNPKARNRVTDNIVEYCKSHPETSYLHFWLADGVNNNCECENCVKKRTSDYYIMMLNELDQKLEAEGLNTKIVFLIYVDLLWKPLYERLKNNKRFVLMFAPIHRSYSSSYSPELKGKMLPYKLNELKFPRDIGENLAYLKDWQEDFKCDSFVFDYHFMWDHYFDFGQYNHAQVVLEDIKNLEAIGLNGFVSCQIQRAFLPTCLNMNVMAESLWNKEIAFKDISDNVLLKEFGEDYPLVQDYLSKLSDLGCAKVIRGEEKIVSEKMVNNLTNSRRVIIEFTSVIKKQIEKNQSKQIVSSWQKLEFHAELYMAMLDIYLEVAKGNTVKSTDKVKDIVLKNEMKFKEVFDAMHFLFIFENHIMKKIYGQFHPSILN